MDIIMITSSWENEPGYWGTIIVNLSWISSWTCPHGDISHDTRRILTPETEIDSYSSKKLFKSEVYHKSDKRMTDCITPVARWHVEENKIANGETLRRYKSVNWTKTAVNAVPRPHFDNKEMRMKWQINSAKTKLYPEPNSKTYRLMGLVDPKNPQLSNHGITYGSIPPSNA